MPVCPGCEQVLSHDRLPTHQRCCRALRGGAAGGPSAAHEMERYVLTLEERLAQQRKDQEDGVEQRLRRLEDELLVE